MYKLYGFIRSGVNGLPCLTYIPLVLAYWVRDVVHVHSGSLANTRQQIPSCGIWECYLLNCYDLCYTP